MDEQQDGPETASNEGLEPNHWHKLAESLGAKIPDEEPASPAAMPAVPTATTAKDKKKASRERPSKPPPPKSHWRTLANMLGIGGAASEEEPEVDETPMKDDDHGPAQSPALPRSDDTAVAVGPHGAPSATTGRSTRSAELGADAAEVDPTVVERQTAAAGTEPNGHDEPPADLGALGPELPPDEEDMHRSKAKSVLESLFQPSPTAFWEELGSETQDENSVRFERQEDVEFVDEDVVPQTESGETDKVRPERTGRGRRGRSRRRRRGRPREESSADILDASFSEESAGPSDSMLRLEASAELFDKTVEDEESERTSDYDLIAKEDQPEPSADRSREKKRITSWEEAISVIVERNLQNRPTSQNPGGSSRPPRGRRRH